MRAALLLPGALIPSRARDGLARRKIPRAESTTDGGLGPRCRRNRKSLDARQVSYSCQITKSMRCFQRVILAESIASHSCSLEPSNPLVSVSATRRPSVKSRLVFSLVAVAAMYLFAGASEAQASLFGKCCKPACCEPSCCEPTCCEAPACEPSCCEAPSCCDSCCDPCCKKPGLLKRLMAKLRCCKSRCHSCCAPSCCEPTCCEAPACEPTCCGH